MGKIEDKIRNQEYISKANQIEQKYGLPPNLLVGLLKTESGFDPEVISGRRKSSAGAVGIAQFMPRTAKDFGIDPRNVDQSIDAAGKYLSQNYKKLGNWDDTLRSYNMGLGNVYKWRQGKMNLPKETAEYVGKIYSNMGAGASTPTSQYYGGEGQGYTGEIYRPYTPPSMTPTENANVDLSGAETEDTAEEKEAKEKIDKVTAEKQSLEDFYAQNVASKPRQTQEGYQPQEETTPSILEQYGQVSQFVDNPIAQEGGIPTSSQGVYDYPMQEVIVPTTDGKITMQNVDYPILGIDELGNKQMMYPNQEYKFEGKTVHEIPQLKNYFNKR